MEPLKNYLSQDSETDRWNAKAGRTSGTKEDARLLNVYLYTLQAKVYDVRRQLLEKNETITAQALKNNLRGTNEKSKMIMIIFQDHNDQMKSLVDKDYSSTTFNTSLVQNYPQVIIIQQ